MEIEPPSSVGLEATQVPVSGSLAPGATISEPQNQPNLLTGLLGPALKLWLRSQVEAVDRLAVGIGSQTAEGNCLTSRQMLAGRIPVLSVEADGVIYRGLHLGQLRLRGQDIRMNLGQAVRGKPLKLLAPICVDLELRMNEAELNASLASPLLASQLGDWLALLMGWVTDGDFGGDSGEARSLGQPQLALAGGALGRHLGADRLGLLAQYGVQAGPVAPSDPEAVLNGAQALEPALELALKRKAGTRVEIAIEAGLAVCNGNVLKLCQPRWSAPPPAPFQTDLSALAELPLQLGPDVAIETLAIAAGQLHLVGQLTIQP